MNKINFTSLGCSRNLVDSEVMINFLLENNFELIDDIKASDIFIINTCGFLKEARQEGYDILDEIFENKKKNSKVIITGCMANLFSEDLIKKYPDIFSIMSAGNIEKIIDVIKTSTMSIDKLSFIQNTEKRVLATPQHLAYLKIAEGCKKACSFCIIPKIKGPLKSRSIASVVDEFKNLLSKDVFEINLIAQDLLDYQKDFNEKNALIKLVKELLKIKKDFWLRLLYVYPDEITDEFIELIISDNRICRYIDLPLQHINDRVLKKMRRRTSQKQIIDIIKKLQKNNISIRTSLMVGFPTETEKAFQELLDFVKEYELDNIGIFKYSNEKDAYASKYDQVDEKIKQDRFERLAALQHKIAKKKNKKLIGKKIQVIVDNYHEETDLLAIGRSHHQAYDVDSNVIINNVGKLTSFGGVYTVKITDVSEYDLVGQIL